mmetsp:Transcript_18689/g.34623  ORF Transcript_18689/g.34623 Transcript_18689/m.34623 type:complete len:355 (+) Transcript_18689:158-1222(+)
MALRAALADARRGAIPATRWRPHARRGLAGFARVREAQVQALVDGVRGFAGGDPGAAATVANVLADARAGEAGGVIDLDAEAIGQELQKIGVDGGYEMQKLTSAALVDRHGAPWRSIGYKIGATAKPVQEKMGLREPFVAEVYAHNALMMSDALEGPLNTVDLPPVHTRGVEAEWGFVLKKDLPVREEPYSRDEISAAIKHVVPTIEVLGTRFAKPPGVSLFLADGGGNGLVVIGPRNTWRKPEDWECKDAGEIAVTTWIDNEIVASGSGRNVLGHPLEALSWLVNRQQRRNLVKGDFVTSGAANGLCPVDNDRLPSAVRVEFQGWARMDITLPAPDASLSDPSAASFVHFVPR